MSLHKTLYFANNELERVLIEINIKRIDNEFDKREFMIDTGADRSAMSTTALSLCGYDLDWINANKTPHRAATADNKMLDAYIIRLPEINIGGFRAIKWPFLVY
ncbi:MAG: retroviral-like aspartic protease family protein [Oscillospiraceae bacterium]|nr:retroviral-like aspartic protease family protein [Oscillospiraceae bacterium]